MELTNKQLTATDNLNNLCNELMANISLKEEYTIYTTETYIVLITQQSFNDEDLNIFLKLIKEFDCKSSIKINSLGLIQLSITTI